MNALITGGLGGIGSTFGYFLFKRGINVFAIDNLNNGYKENSEINGESYCTLFHGDIRNTEFLRQIITENKISAIIHLAAISSLPACEENPIECYSVNTMGTLSVLEAARTTGIKTVVFASTSAIYENVKDNKLLTESLCIPNPTLVYPISKKHSEDLCKSYREKYNIRIPILRFFNVFGPRQDIYRKSPPLINYITREILNNRIPVLHSDGKQSRDYIHVDDVCRALFTALYKGKKTYNICSGKLISVNEIYEIISKTLNFPYPAKFNPPEKLWKDYNININEDLIAKETNKTALGCNEKIKKELKITIDTDIKKLIAETVLEISKNYVGK